MLQNYALVLTAGMLATVNPCGFALLPAYMAAFVGMDDRRSRGDAFGRALAVSGVLTLGFITVFGVVGIIISSLVSSISAYLPWATIVVGFVLIGLGVWLLLGHELRAPVPKFNRGGSDGTLLSMYLFGVSYAVASLSCAIGPFLAATSTTLAAGSFLQRLIPFVLFGLGMGLVVGVVTVAVALAKNGIVNRFRRLLPVINKIAGALMLLVGLYVAYYGWYEVRLLVFKQNVSDPIIDTALGVQSWLARNGPTKDNVVWWALVMLLFLAGAAVVSRRAGRRSPDAPES